MGSRETGSPRGSACSASVVVLGWALVGPTYGSRGRWAGLNVQSGRHEWARHWSAREWRSSRYGGTEKVSAGLLGAAPASGSPSRGRGCSWLPVRRAGPGPGLGVRFPSPALWSPWAGAWGSIPQSGVLSPWAGAGRGPSFACLPGGAPSSGLAPPRACGGGPPFGPPPPFLAMLAALSVWPWG